MKLSFVDLCGFRGYRKRMHMEFADGFTVVDGRNGAGKSTIFDAVEFALTGTLTKYRGATAARESVADYLWWIGDGSRPEDRSADDHYVEVGFRDSEGEVRLRRTPFAGPDESVIRRFTERICSTDLVTSSAFSQLCAASILRDEHIAELSVDLKEAERYDLVCTALGAPDSEAWIARAAKLVSLAKSNVVTAQAEVAIASAAATTATRTIDELRANQIPDALLAAAVDRVRLSTGSMAPIEQLPGATRERIAKVNAIASSLERIVAQSPTAEETRLQLSSLAESVAAADAEVRAAEEVLLLLPAGEARVASDLAQSAQNLITLANLGRLLGLQEGHCPLCSKQQSRANFERGILAAETLARTLDQDAAAAQQHEIERMTADQRIVQARNTLELAKTAHVAAASLVAHFDQECEVNDIPLGTSLDEVKGRIARLQAEGVSLQHDLSLLETFRVSEQLQVAELTATEAAATFARAQERFGRARKGETAASALHNAARRASGDILNTRLARILPLMSELYRRLRPHPMWNEVDYSIRGDLKRFLRLQVGDNLNPQFIFSSGQRRAAGLAFLLSVHLSVSWSKWRTLLLDDPVQHIDDFRAVHLAEVLAHLVADGRQVVCAVEDPALADLLCRRLPVHRMGSASRVTLGLDKNGDLAKLSEHQIKPFPRNSLVLESVRAAG